MLLGFVFSRGPRSETVSLTELLRDQSSTNEIASHLDALPQTQRIAQLHALGSKQQAQLYEMAADSAPLSLDFFVPPEIGDEREVIHHGRNSQPAFRNFQKRWSRPTGRPGQLYGYNEAGARPLIGPGYFVARLSDGDGADSRGAVVVDYFKVPEGPVPVGWPEVRPNHRGLQRFVYNNSRDYMRRVSDHCSIGVAYRHEKRLMGYFVLCRDETVDR